MSKIDFNQKIPGKRQAVFVIPYILKHKPWSLYKNASERQKELVVPQCVMINRSDGRIGLAGGGVCEGESLEEALRREVREEIGLEIASELEPVVAHDIGDLTVHVYAVELSGEELDRLRQTAHQAEHFGSEITGVFLPHLIDYEGMGGRGGLVELLRHSVAPKVREELAHFLIQKNVFEKEKLADIYQRAGFSLDEHLI